MTRALRILRIERLVTDLRRAAAFYESALGFAASPSTLDSTKIALHRGAQTLMLISGGTSEHVTANDQSFQHIALPVTDMQAAFTHLQKFTPRMITKGGPVLLPLASGSVTALKFYDPDGHPVEFLQFPDHRPGGLDHSAIVVTDAERSIAFYRDTLALRLTARQTNTGPEQDRLDGLTGAIVDVIAFSPDSAPPHVELLAYRSPKLHPSNASPSSRTRFVFEVDAATPPNHLQYPDGHALTLLPKE
jgi:catechol 2,3-dioxygenase-like lactoylglutathione lyase family enzyme